MADADSNYAPRSPDLSALDHSSYSLDPQQSFPQFPPFDQPSFAHQPLAPQIPQSQPQYQQQPHLQHQQQQQQQQQQFYPVEHQFLSSDPQAQQPDSSLDPDPDWFPDEPNEAMAKPSTRKRKQAALKQRGGAPEEIPLGLESGVDVTRGIDIKTKFPVARIKRIMQADEDVGKVAQVTPVAVSKALELFMIAIVCGAADEAEARNSKRVTATHLKQAIQKDQRFDFLLEKVEKVPDAPAPAAENDGNSEDAGPKRKKRGGRKKVSDGDDD